MLGQCTPMQYATRPLLPLSSRGAILRRLLVLCLLLLLLCLSRTEVAAGWVPAQAPLPQQAEVAAHAAQLAGSQFMQIWPAAGAGGWGTVSSSWHEHVS
jgi:hypothetical protein